MKALWLGFINKLEGEDTITMFQGMSYTALRPNILLSFSFNFPIFTFNSSGHLARQSRASSWVMVS